MAPELVLDGSSFRGTCVRAPVKGVGGVAVSGARRLLEEGPNVYYNLFLSRLQRQVKRMSLLLGQWGIVFLQSATGMTSNPKI